MLGMARAVSESPLDLCNNRKAAIAAGINNLISVYNPVLILARFWRIRSRAEKRIRIKSEALEKSSRSSALVMNTYRPKAL